MASYAMESIEPDDFPEGKVVVVADNTLVYRAYEIIQMADELGQAETARRLGLSTSYISRIVRKQRCTG